MKKFIAAAMLNFSARSFQTARALLTGSSPGLLDYETIKLTFLRRSCEGKGKIVFHINIRNLIYKYVLSLKKLATDNVIKLMYKFSPWKKLTT